MTKSTVSSLLNRLSAAVALTGAAWLTVACSGDSTAVRSGAESVEQQPVIAARVEFSPETVTVEAVGTARALKSVSIRPRVSGRVELVNIESGQFVERGQTLMQLDARDERLALENATVALDDARRRLKRYRQSIDSGAVTQSELDDAQSAVARAQIAVRRAELDLEYQSVEAPFAGHVGMTHIDPGAWVDNTTVITTLDRRQTLRVDFELPELLLGQMREGQTVALATWRKGQVVAEGKVADIDSRVDPDERTFTVRAHVPNRDDRLRPGMSFRITVSLEGNDYALLPEVALQWGAGGSYVWAIRDGRARQTLATIVQRRAGQVLVDGDLPEGSLVVAEGIQMMRDNGPVQVAQVVDARQRVVSRPASDTPAGEVSGE